MVLFNATGRLVAPGCSRVPCCATVLLVLLAAGKRAAVRFFAVAVVAVVGMSGMSTLLMMWITWVALPCDAWQGTTG